MGGWCANEEKKRWNLLRLNQGLHAFIFFRFFIRSHWVGDIHSTKFSNRFFLVSKKTMHKQIASNAIDQKWIDIGKMKQNKLESVQLMFIWDFYGWLGILVMSPLRININIITFVQPNDGNKIIFLRRCLFQVYSTYCSSGHIISCSTYFFVVVIFYLQNVESYNN